MKIQSETETRMSKNLIRERQDTHTHTHTSTMFKTIKNEKL